mgnify:CR=1 FL=1
MERAKTTINAEVNAKLDMFLQKNPFFKKQELISYATTWAIEYYNRHGQLPAPAAPIQPAINAELVDLANQAADLPGMSMAVIQSHLIRFPRVSPKRYAEILAQLHTMQQTQEGLKNPEGVAYGLAKRSNNCSLGQARRQETKTDEEPKGDCDENSIPDDALYPYA